MNTDDVRMLWSQSGFTYQTLTAPKLEMLSGLLSQELSVFAMDGNMYMTVAKKTIWWNKDGSISSCEIIVDGPYFKDREGITFNRNGFIGFAGWASSNNVQPFIRAFVLWIEWLKEVSE